MKKTKNIISRTGKCLLVFGILFSQLSFPLNVLADELAKEEFNQKEDIQPESITKIDNTYQETTEIEDTQLVETNPENKEEEKQQEENDEIPSEDNSEEEKPSSLSFTIELIEDACIIKNTLNTTISIQELKQSLENIIKVTDGTGNEITDETTLLHSGEQIIITNEEQVETTYTLVIFGDYDDNGMINVEDQQILLNILKSNVEEDILMEIMPLLDLNQDNKFNILDVTYPIFTENTWENTNTANDNLENYLISSNEEVYLGEEMEVNYFIEGFQLDTLVGIQGILNYNKELLELTKIQVNGIEENILELENGMFAYLLANYHQDGALITFKFKALAVGTPIVSLDNIIASIGGTSAKLDVSKVSTSFNALEYGKGGDEEENNSYNNTQVSQPTISTTTTNLSEVETTTTTVVTQVATTKTIALSSDNYMKSLVIKGHDINFDKNTYEYSITVKNSVSSLDLTVTLNNELATYYVEGNKDFKVGENTVNIVVKAEDGSTRTYSIKVNKEKKESNNTKNNDKEEQKENSSSKTVIIILIILVIIGLIYVIFKDDEEDKKESRK